jgi:hypothetical protein
MRSWAEKKGGGGTARGLQRVKMIGSTNEAESGNNEIVLGSVEV